MIQHISQKSPWKRVVHQLQQPPYSADSSASCGVSIVLVACTTKSAVSGLEYAADMMLILIGRIKMQLTVHKALAADLGCHLDLSLFSFFPHRTIVAIGMWSIAAKQTILGLERPEDLILLM